MNKKLSKTSAFLCAIAVLGTLANTGFINANAEENSYNAVFNVNLTGEKKEISPYIYGVNESANLDNVTATAVRQGGNRYTGYNWETNYSNAGEDWKNSSDTYLSSSSTPGACAIKLSEDCQEHNIGYKFTTLQMAGYVSADSNGSVSEDETAPSSRWNKVVNRKDGILSLTPDLDDGVVYMDEYVNYLVQTLGDATTSTGIQGYSLDNEPALWDNTHPYIHSEPTTMTEFIEKSIDLAKVVKDVDSNAEVFGGAFWGYLSYKRFDSLDTNQNELENLQADGYNWFIDYYLDCMKKASDEYGSRLIDYLDIHYYAQATSSDEDILQGVRTLYDEDFVENSWIGEMKQWYPNDLPILPNVQNAIDTYYPDTKLAISEYNFGGGSSVVGSIVEAEALGCFAENGIYLATLWDLDDGTEYTYSGINLFTNYDGNGSTFGDTLLETTVEDNSKSNAYASTFGDDDSQVDIVVTNKDTQNDEVATINLENSSSSYKSAVVYGIVEGSSDIVVLDKIDNIQDNSFEVDLPSLSVVHIVVSNDSNAFDNVEISTPQETPTYTTLTLNASDYTDSDGNIVLNLDNPENIAKIVIETDITSTQGSQWWYGGGGMGVTIDSGWAYKGFSFNKTTNALEFVFDGTFTNADKEEVSGSFTSNKFEIQRWWTVSEIDDENGSDIDFNYKTITIYYNTESSVGDVNNDGSVNYVDLLALKKHILGVSTLKNTSSADVNNDGSINVIDTIALKSILL